jgi:chromosome segregation ATPase
MESKRKNDAVNTLKMDISQYKKKFKKLENERNKLKNTICENKMKLDKLRKEKDDIAVQQMKVAGATDVITGEQKLLTEKKDTLEKEDNAAKEEVGALEKNIEEQESKLRDLKRTEADALKTIKNLTTLRETMARRASGAMAEVRETREELKIKELLMLDLTKKQQEIEFKLNSFKVDLF